MTNVSHPSVSGNETLDFMREVFRGAETGHAVVWTKQDRRTVSFPVAELPAAAEAMRELAPNADVYFARGLQGVAPEGRGEAAGVVWAGGLTVDFDTREGPHKGAKPETLPADAAEVRKLIAEAGLPAPSILIHTGGGVHAWWLYADPVLLSGPEARAAEEMVAKAWSRRLAGVFQRHGYKLDSTFALNHPFKAPGTLNHKTPDPKPVAWLDRGEIVARFERAELRTLVAEGLKTAARGIPGAGAGTMAAQFADEARRQAKAKAKPDELAPILAGCAWLAELVRRAEAGEPLSEPEWYKLIGIVARTVDGRRRVHEISAHDVERYSFEETEAKIEHALEASGPPLCETIAAELGCADCARCPFRASIRSPMTLATEPPAVVRVVRGAVYVEKGRSWLHLASGETFDTTEFADKERSKLGRNPHDILMASRITPKVLRRDYRAGVSELILREESGTLSVNLWQRGGVEPVAGDCTVILEYLARLIPDEASRRFLVQYLAHLVQRPADKIEHGVILSGDYGTGKSTLGRLVAVLLGTENVRKIEGAELGQQWTARLVNVQALMIEEVHHGERLEVSDKLKELMTAEFYNAEEKYMSRAQGRTPRGVFLASNDTAPLVLKRGQRRWTVLATQDRPETEAAKRNHHAFFAHLDEALSRDDSTVAAFAAYLHTVSLEGFSRKEAIETAATAAATEASRTPTAQVLAELIEAGAVPLHKDVVEMADVFDALRRSTWAANLERLGPKKVAQAMRDLGARQVNMDGGKHLELFIKPGKKARLWAVRNVARWAGEGREALRTEFERKLGDPGDNVMEFPDPVKRLLEEAARQA